MFSRSWDYSAEPQTRADTSEVEELVTEDERKPALADPWAFFERVLGWEARHVAGAPAAAAAR